MMPFIMYCVIAVIAFAVCSYNKAPKIVRDFAVVLMAIAGISFLIQFK